MVHTLTQTLTYRRLPETASEIAVAKRILSKKKTAPNYVGKYAYIGDNQEGLSVFVNLETYKCLPPCNLGVSS